MTTTLLRTKLFISPVPPELVSRPRLTERFEAGLHRKLTLVSAPAGFGKTTLLSEWAHLHGGENTQASRPVAWLSLDKDDNSPSRFWTYFTAALQTMQPDLGASVLAMLQTPKPPPVESVLTVLINDMIEKLDSFILILDDYHTIENKSIHSAMGFLLEYMPSQMHLAIASRLDPPLPLARLRGRGQLSEFYTTDLRFTLDETAAFFNEVMRLGLTDENVVMLEDRTEGWIASLQMAAISMQGRNDIPGFIQAFSGNQRHLLDYLLEEVLYRQPADVQSFLLVTSVLDRLTVPLCNAVTERKDAQEKLDYLEAANLFIVPLDNESRWFRYHHLFADLLRNQLARSQPDLQAPLHHRASVWFEQEGLMAEAIDHALAAEDFERAANLIETVAVPKITMESKVSILLDWTAKLPDELITTRPWLCIALASAYLAAGQLDDVEPLLMSAEATLSTTGEETSAIVADNTRIRCLVMALRANTACVQGDIQRTLELCREAFKHLPDDEIFARAPISVNLGVAYAMKGEMKTASRYLSEAATYGQTSGNLYISLIAMGCLAETQAKQGFLYQAAETNRHALRVGAEWGDVGEPLSATSYAHISLAQILYQWNELDEAIQHMTDGIQLSEQSGNALIVLLGYPGLALLNEFQHKTNSLAESGVLTKGIANNPHNALLSKMAAAWQARLSLAHGDLKAVELWSASQEFDLSSPEAPDFLQEFSYLTLIRLRIAQGRVDEVTGMLESLRQKAKSECRMGSIIEILILQSIALKLQDKMDQAITTLEHALSLAEPEGYVRIFVDEGESISELLSSVALHSIAPEYINKLLASFRDSELHFGDQPVRLMDENSQYNIQPSKSSEILSMRELEVLQLMAAGASSKEIADELFITVGTAKNHKKQIYRKLDVHKQSTAVIRAQKLGLL